MNPRWITEEGVPLQADCPARVIEREAHAAYLADIQRYLDEASVEAERAALGRYLAKQMKVFHRREMDQFWHQAILDGVAR